MRSSMAAMRESAAASDVPAANVITNAIAKARIDRLSRE